MSTLEIGGQIVRRGGGTEGRAWTTTKTCGHRERGRSMAVFLRAYDSHPGSREFNVPRPIYAVQSYGQTVTGRCWRPLLFF